MKSEIKGKGNSSVKEIKKIKLLSVAKIFGLFGLVVGILSILEYGLVKLMPSFALQLGIDASSLTAGVIFGYALMIFLVYVVMGLIVSLLYNWFAKLVGGIRIVLD